jgi:serine/threonine protein kinase
MKAEHWQQLDNLFHAALERAPEQRAAFLDEACAGDESMRKQVDALLSAHEEAGSFIDAPAFEAEARALADSPEHPDSIVGQVISHYRIISSLGAGGMGEVYLAHDMALGRQVALKLLPARFIGDGERLRRFEQEARAASALNHPNILTVYEIGQAESLRFIATEYIDGVTLREQMAGKPMKIEDAVEVALQIAAALVAAHAKGIIHRDIKPENVVTKVSGQLGERDIHVKVLDFGIAKLTEADASGTELPTRMLASTSAGVTLGTAPYMSPEQAQGFRVDVRTDIWSLGVVLYEMVSGRAPFEGSTRSHLIVSILEKTPPPLRANGIEVPEQLEWIVTKALRKDRDERYQTARELHTDLKEFRRRLQTAGQASSDLAGPNLISPTNEPQTNPSSIANDFVPVRTETPTALVAGGNRRRIVLASVLVMIVVAFALGLKYFWSKLPGSNSAAPFSHFKLTRLTTNGNATSAVISPDGKYVVHVMGATGQQSLWLRHIATGSDKEIVPSNGKPIGSPSFSADGNHICYVREDSGALTLFQVPVLGGSGKALLRDIDTPATFSPDSKKFAFVRGDPGHGEASLIIAQADGTGEQKLATHHMQDFFYGEAGAASWSPDGERIAIALRDSRTANSFFNVTMVEIKERKESRLTAEKWSSIHQIGWLPDGRGILVTAIAPERTNTQVWYASYPGGQVRRITNDLNNYEGISTTSGALSAVTVLSEGSSDVWVAAGEDLSHASKITSNRFDGVAGLAWTPDAKIVHVSNVSGNRDVWIMNEDGSEDRQLTSNAGLHLAPSVSFDGRYIVFMSNPTGQMTIWRMDIDGGNQKQLAPGFSPNCTPDGQVLYFPGDEGQAAVWKVSIEGGNPVRLTDYVSHPLSVSPVDGRIVIAFDETTPPRRRVAVIGPNGGAPTNIFDFPLFSGTLGGGFYGQTIRWMSDGRALSYIVTRNGVSNLWSQPIEGGPPKQLTDFKSDLIFSYAWSRDGKKLALARGTKTSDVVLISHLADAR